MTQRPNRSTTRERGIHEVRISTRAVADDAIPAARRARRRSLERRDRRRLSRHSPAARYPRRRGARDGMTATMRYELDERDFRCAREGASIARGRAIRASIARGVTDGGGWTNRALRRRRARSETGGEREKDQEPTRSLFAKQVRKSLVLRAGDGGDVEPVRYPRGHGRHSIVKGV